MLEMSCISFQFLYIFLDPAQTITMIVKNFIQCGFIGWGAELIWTSLHNRIQNHDKRWMGHSSLFMFPIYGMAALFKPCSRWLRSIRSGKFSRGMKKQVAFRLALSMRPDYLILDEPVDGLDPVMRRQVWSLVMADSAEYGTTVLVSSHNLRELEEICDHIGIMNRGKMLAEKNVECGEDLESLFLNELGGVNYDVKNILL